MSPFYVEGDRKLVKAEYKSRNSILFLRLPYGTFLCLYGRFSVNFACSFGNHFRKGEESSTSLSPLYSAARYENLPSRVRADDSCSFFLARVIETYRSLCFSRIWSADRPSWGKCPSLDSAAGIHVISTTIYQHNIALLESWFHTNTDHSNQRHLLGAAFWWIQSRLKAICISTVSSKVSIGAWLLRFV